MIAMKRAVVVVLLFAAACKSGPSKDDCSKLLDHLVDLEFKKAGAAASSDAMRAEITKSKGQVTSNVADTFMKTCTEKMSKTRVTCALAAADLEGEGSVAKCDDAK
jgi:hypothetical protein